MAGKIKGITIEIGGDTQPLEKALGDVNKKTRDLQGELKAVERLLKLDPGNVELLAQKQKLLAQQVDNSREKLTRLKSAQEQVNQAFQKGDLGEEQYRHFSRTVINAEQDLNKFEGELKKIDRQADKTGRSLKDMGEKVGDIGGKMTAGVTLPVVGGALALTEGTREDRQDFGKLEAAFTTSGFTSEQAMQTYKEFYGILGETDTAIEAANHLTELAKSQEDLEKWVTISTGVYAKFGDSLPIEGLTEAANETAKVGKVTGPLADALNWVGVSEDEMNASLEKCTSEQERQALITDTLMGKYTGIAQKYREVNKNVIEANKANADLKNELNDLAAKIEPIVTRVVKFVSGLIDKFNNLPGPVQNAILVIAGIAAVLGPVLMFVGKAMVFFELFGGKLGGVVKIGSKVIGFITRLGPIIIGAIEAIAAVLGISVGWMIAIIVGLIAAGYLLIKNWDKVKAFGISMWESISSAWHNNMVYLKAGMRDAGDTIINIWSQIKGKILEAMAKAAEFVGAVDTAKSLQYQADIEIYKPLGIAGERRSHLANGTDFFKGGLTWVGERGPELLNLPRGSQVFNNRESMAMMNGNQTVNHTGVIRVEGVNNMNELIGVAEIVIGKKFEQGNRRIPTRVSTMPSMA